MSDKKFATAINCMDGRTQIPVIKWLKKEYNIDYVDMITEPGPNKILAENTDKALVESIKRRVDISVNKHHSRIIAIIGHHDCAGNPTDKETQLHQINSAIKNIKKWGYNTEVVGLWVDEPSPCTQERGENWRVDKVEE
jgi:hypothetical protein